MNSIFTFADDSTDFGFLNKQGISGVIIKDTEKISENIKKAAACEMNIWVMITSKTEEKTGKLSYHDSGIFTEKGKITYVSLRNIRILMSKIGSAINEVTGFILPVPLVDGPMLPGSLEKEMIQDLYCLFDGETKISPMRSWYYTNLEKHIIENYMKPQKELLENRGKSIVFNIGRQDALCYLARRMINPVTLKREEFSVGVECNTTSRVSGVENGDFLIADKGAVRIEALEDVRILLVKPTRGIMERYVQQGKPTRLETPALVAEIEGEYYSDMLTRKGYSFRVADEFSFEKEIDFSEYEHILICPSCLFSETGMDVLERLKNTGIKINCQDLISDLAIEGEEEWEK